MSDEQDDLQTNTDGVSDGTLDKDAAGKDTVLGVGDDAGKQGDDDAGGDQAAADEAAAAAKAAAEKGGDDDGDQVPESYEFNMPEGMELDTALAETATPIFKEMGLQQEAVDKLTGMFAGWQQSQINDAAKAFGEQLDNWAKELKNDKDFGGDDYGKNSAIADLAVEKLGSQELRDFLQASGGCNHPAVVKFMWAVGKFVSEDASGDGGGDVDDESTIEDRLYPAEAKTAAS